MVHDLSKNDIRSLYLAWQTLQEERDNDGPRVEMTSKGYVSVWSDGAVVAYGTTILDLTEYENEPWITGNPLFPVLERLARECELPRAHREDLEHDRRALAIMAPDTAIGWILYADGTHLVALDAPFEERAAYASTADHWPEARYFLIKPGTVEEVSWAVFTVRVRVGVGGAR